MNLLHLLLLILVLAENAVSASDRFIFNGFQLKELTMDGSATVTSEGSLCLNVDTNSSMPSHAFYPSRFQVRNESFSSASAADDDASGEVLSFSTLFAFVINSTGSTAGDGGFAFALSPTPAILGSTDYLGLFNSSNVDISSTNHIFAVHFGAAAVNSSSVATAGNLVRIHINSSSFLSSTSPGSYFAVAWIDYRSDLQQLNVSVSPLAYHNKPEKPLLSTTLNLSSVFKDFMYVGFSSGGAGNAYGRQCILGWSFRINGEAQSLEIFQRQRSSKRHIKIMACSIATAAVLVSVVSAACYMFCKRRKKNESNEMEGWELEQPRNFPYKLLSKATHRFSKSELLGKGGFGKVYKGVLPGTSMEIAVKRVSDDGKQGLREFMAEVSSLGRLRHRNLVQLQGWCRRKDELLLVYDYMPNGSLDSFLFNDRKAKDLGWEERFKILKGIANGLLYLHEGWEQVVVHRDVKASNVLLDAEMNGRLGDFGLARFYEHGDNPQTTRVVGTLGYIAPEMSRSGKATASADVYSYGALLLEVASGKKPYEMLAADREGEMLLVEWVLKNWQRGQILSAMDARLEGGFVREEAELVLKLGVLCSQAVAERRPTMRQVVQYLDGDASLPKEVSLTTMALQDYLGFDQLELSYPESGIRSYDSNTSECVVPMYEI
ncbi:L-type lectin-domain containing receptor kinase SIT2-like [Nymphaea colorata]|uniref:L-type lectin-domain containing receptor kinase SIT2-like n=1 Tax=Nymphaea colorata TaxID=210225 RepID=UPI00214F4FEB|nr:L-type lectin-domain containing receptor kinase SIT2-like [Nymphaea colorata]